MILVGDSFYTAMHKSDTRNLMEAEIVVEHWWMHNCRRCEAGKYDSLELATLLVLAFGVCLTALSAAWQTRDSSICCDGLRGMLLNFKTVEISCYCIISL